MGLVFVAPIQQPLYFQLERYHKHNQKIYSTLSLLSSSVWSPALCHLFLPLRDDCHGHFSMMDNVVTDTSENGAAQYTKTTGSHYNEICFVIIRRFADPLSWRPRLHHRFARYLKQTEIWARCADIERTTGKQTVATDQDIQRLTRTDGQRQTNGQTICQTKWIGLPVDNDRQTDG